jgi:hypothetical protein
MNHRFLTALLFVSIALSGCMAKEPDPNAQVGARLKALAEQFDADKDQRLSPAEQTALIQHVTKVHGVAWGDRVQTFLKMADTNGDGIVDRDEFNRALKQLDKIVPPAAKPQTFMIAMSDGMRLATDVYLPEGKGPFPVLFLRTPYSRTKSGHPMDGFAFVVQDMRGRFDSEGENLPFFGCGWAPHHDGLDSVQWIRKQPWCNGKIGTLGESACGITQNLLAGAGPQGVTAQYIGVAVPSLYQYAAYVGGALRKCQMENWTTGNRFDAQAVALIKAHPCYDAYWQQFDVTRKFSEVNLPAVHQGGWFDTFCQGTIDAFVGRQHLGAEGARGKQKLVMGPWEHGGSKHGEVGELRFPNDRMPKQYELPRWFEYHLLGIDNGVMREPAVAYYVMGDTSDPQAPGNQWRQADDWPIPAHDTPYYFDAKGKLSVEKPAAAAGTCRQYTFDPADPCPTIGGGNLTIPRGPRNQNRIESRSDVLLYTTNVLDEPVEVTGRLRAKIHVSSSAVDSDLSVRLCDVYPDGKSYLLADGILRLRYRNSFEKPEPLPPASIVPVEVDCWSTSIVFNRGHRIRVTVTSGNYPRFDINPGTGQPWTDDGPKIRQTNRIYCDAEHPSAMILPIVRIDKK